MPRLRNARLIGSAQWQKGRLSALHKPVQRSVYARREFIAGLVGRAAWPLVARAQHSNRIRRVAVLAACSENDPEAQARVNALESGLLALGWVNGRNIQLEYRWAPGGQTDVRNRTAEMVAGAPDLIVAAGTSVLLIVREATQSIPVVFIGVS